MFRMENMRSYRQELWFQVHGRRASLNITPRWSDASGKVASEKA